MRNWYQITNLLALLFIGFQAQAESLPEDLYYVASDVKVDSIKKGVCIVRGRVWDAYSETGVSAGIIANFDRSRHTVTNDSGYYELTLSAKDTAIFFYHPKYNELVCWSYDFKSQHLVTMNFVTSEKLPEGIIQVQEKPVIYLYTQQKTNVRLTLDPKIELTYTYPIYEVSWDVEANPDGQIVADGRTYPYLFWEGVTNQLKLKSTQAGIGEYAINTDSTVSFLERAAQNFGFNSTESTDFITHWAPRIQKYPYANIQFLVDDEYDNEIGSLTVTPQPDKKRRVYIIFQGSDHYHPASGLKQNAIPKIDRTGFVLIEWGGTDLTTWSSF